MTEAPIVLNVHFEAVPGREADLLRELSALVEPTRKEPGCLVYELHIDPEHPGKLMFYANCADQAALDFHVSPPPFKKFVSYRDQGDPVAAVTLTRWRSMG